MPWCCIYNNVITCFPNAARRAQFAVTFRWLSSLSCRIISHVRVDDQFNRAAPSIEINPTLFEARNTSRYNHACQSQRCCRGHEGINRTGITRAMALNALKNNKSNVPVILAEAFIKLSIQAGNFRALSNVNETFTFESQLSMVHQVESREDCLLAGRNLRSFLFFDIFAISRMIIFFFFRKSILLRI